MVDSQTCPIFTDFKATMAPFAWPYQSSVQWLSEKASLPGVRSDKAKKRTREKLSSLAFFLFGWSSKESRMMALFLTQKLVQKVFKERGESFSYLLPGSCGCGCGSAARGRAFAGQHGAVVAEGGVVVRALDAGIGGDRVVVGRDAAAHHAEVLLLLLKVVVML